VRRADLLYWGVLWISVCCECCVLSGRVLCNWLVNFIEESYGSLTSLDVVSCQLEVCATG